MQIDASDAVLGDLDGDGDLDAYLVLRVQSAADFSQVALVDRLWENRDGRLLDVGAGADVAQPTAGVEAAIVDVDGDGHNDIVVAAASVYQGPGGMNLPSPTRIFLNQGSGALTAARFAAAPDALSGFVSRMAAGDVDADGDPDIVLAVPGAIEVWLNQGGIQSGVAGAYALAQTINGAPFEASKALALGSLVGDARLDLVFEHPATDTVRVHAGAPGALPFAAAGTVLEIAFPPTDPLQPVSDAITELVVGQLDGVGRDDLLVATTRGATVFFASVTDTLVQTTQEFPSENLASAAIADLNNDGRNDVVLGRSEARAEGSIRYIGAAGTGDFVVGAQCFGSQFLVRSLAAGDVDADGLVDVLAVGVGRASGSFPAPGDGITLYSNDAAFGLDACCAAETAALGPWSSLESPRGAVVGAWRRIGEAAVDLAAIDELRRESLLVTDAGRRMAQNYVLFSDEVSALMRADPTLARQGRNALAAWRDDLVALNRWRGHTVFVEPEQIDAVDQFLTALAAAGSPALAQMIQAERQLQPPLQDFVGMDLDQFRRVTLDFRILFRDGFDD